MWFLVSWYKDTNVIGTKWIFKNKIDAFGNITRNKVRLVAQDYNQIEGIDFDETFAPVANPLDYCLILHIYLDLNYIK